MSKLYNDCMELGELLEIKKGEKAIEPFIEKWGVAAATGKEHDEEWLAQLRKELTEALGE